MGARDAVATLVAVVLLALAGGCSDDATPGGAGPGGPGSASRTIVVTPPSLDPGVGLSFLQQRVFEGTRRADVRVLNGTGRGVVVRSVGLRWPGYPSGPQPDRATVSPGATLDLRYRLPDPDCRPALLDEPMRAEVTTASGRTLVRDLDDAGVRFLTRIWGTACDERRLAAAVGTSWVVPDPRRAAEVDDAEPLDSTLPVRLRLQRLDETRRGEDVTVTSLSGTVLFDLTLDGDAARRSLAAGRDRLDVPVTVDPGRCDEHARSQASQPFTFRVGALLGDATDPVSVVVEPSRAAQARLLRFLDLACAGITDH